jgi:hypothetical protein
MSLIAKTRRRWGVRLMIALGAIAVLVLVMRLVADPMATRYVRKILDRHDETSVARQLGLPNFRHRNFCTLP